MDDLIAFLRARINEDRAAAELFDPKFSPSSRSNIDNAQRWNRMLADCEAKERIVDLMVELIDESIELDENSANPDYAPGEEKRFNAYAVLRLMTIPYSTHWDCRDEWRPRVPPNDSALGLDGLS